LSQILTWWLPFVSEAAAIFQRISRFAHCSYEDQKTETIVCSWNNEKSDKFYLKHVIKDNSVSAGIAKTTLWKSMNKVNNRAFRLVVRSPFVFANSNCDFLKLITWFILANHSCCLQNQIKIELQVERLVLKCNARVMFLILTAHYTHV